MVSGRYLIGPAGHCHWYARFGAPSRRVLPLLLQFLLECCLLLLLPMQCTASFDAASASIGHIVRALLLQLGALSRFFDQMRGSAGVAR